MRPFFLILPLLFALGACAEIVVTEAPRSTAPQEPAPPRVGRAQTEANFRTVVARMEPVAERECRRRTSGVNCDFRVVVDDRPNQAPNAFQTLDDNGRPIIGFNTALIADARNQDELAFIFGHEAAHHIEGHIPQSQRSAMGGALAGAVLAGALGLDAGAGQTVTDIGATVGARRYSKEFELEADALGTVIAARAGYDPLVGARFFQRIPDPGDQFLGTHPPNAERIRTVERVAAGL
ncbi:MAG: M48 family metallopeptidase [Paracoccaceae bacterium]|nr:M48 family metallopeptidase [Paracoccaceae bacterium]